MTNAVAKCPRCQGGATKIIDTRKYESAGPAVRRRRACLYCDERWTTYEVSGGIFRLLQKLAGRTGISEREALVALSKYYEISRVINGGKR